MKVNENNGIPLKLLYSYVSMKVNENNGIILKLL